VAVVRDAVVSGVALDGVNVMTMDYGDAAPPEPDGRMGEYGISAVVAVMAQVGQIEADAGIPMGDDALRAMIGSTPMIGRNDVSTEVFRLEDAAETVDFAASHGMGMLSMWSLGRDHPCPDQARASSDCSSTTDQTEDWQYLAAFGAFGR
jgi:chitinase